LGPVMDGKMSLNEAGALIFEAIVEASQGKLTKSEITGHKEFGIFRVGWSF